MVVGGSLNAAVQHTMEKTAKLMLLLCGMACVFSGPSCAGTMAESSRHRNHVVGNPPSLPHSVLTPPLPENLTLIALRPYNITGLDNKDSADVYGEALFYFTAKLMLPLQCRTNPSYFECDDAEGTGRLLLHNEVYTQYVVQTTGDYAIYAACNPDMHILPWGSVWNCTTLSVPTTDPRVGVTNMCGDDWYVISALTSNLSLLPATMCGCCCARYLHWIVCPALRALLLVFALWT